MSTSMTRRHFTLIADTIRYMDLDSETRERVIKDMRLALGTTNSRFDGERFAEACRPAKD